MRFHTLPAPTLLMVGAVARDQHPVGGVVLGDGDAGQILTGVTGVGDLDETDAGELGDEVEVFHLGIGGRPGIATHQASEVGGGGDRRVQEGEQTPVSHHERHCYLPMVRV